MPLSVSDLLLPPARSAQLEAALANTGAAAPLETLLAEAEARVDQSLEGRSVAAALRTSLVRAFCLHAAYALAGPVPKDIQALYDEAVKLVDVVARSSDPVAEDSLLAGAYGGDAKVLMRL